MNKARKIKRVDNIDMKNQIEYKFLYKSFDCAVVYAPDEQFGGYRPIKLSAVFGDVRKSHIYKEWRRLDSNEKCRDFLIFQTQKFIDNNFEAKVEDIKAYFLENSPELSEKEKKMVYEFFVTTNNEFMRQLKVLNNSENKQDFLDIFTKVRNEIIKQRELLGQKIDFNLSDEGESIGYLKCMRSEVESLYQPQERKIENLFKQKFHHSIIEGYQNPKDYKIQKKISTPFVSKNEIDWSNPKNTILAFAVVAIVLLIVGFRGQADSNDYDRAMRETILKNHNSKDGPIDCSGTNSANIECQYLLNLPYDQNINPQSFPY